MHILNVKQFFDRRLDKQTVFVIVLQYTYIFSSLYIFVLLLWVKN